MFQTCWQLVTSRANTTCWRLVCRLATSCEIFTCVVTICALLKRGGCSWEFRNKSLDESFLNSHVVVNKQKQELHESWWELRSESWYESFLNSYVLFEREQELHESWWELTSESSYESFLNSYVLFEREQELHESWWELTSESWYESFLNSYVLFEREQELHESWQARVFSTLIETKWDICFVFSRLISFVVFFWLSAYIIKKLVIVKWVELM